MNTISDYNQGVLCYLVICTLIVNVDIKLKGWEPVDRQHKVILKLPANTSLPGRPVGSIFDQYHLRGLGSLHFQNFLWGFSPAHISPVFGELLGPEKIVQVIYHTAMEQI